MNYDIFISYSRQDAGWVEKLVHLICSEMRHPTSKQPLRVFRDTDSLQAGKGLLKQLNDAVAQSHCVLAIISEAYANSEYCRREWRLMDARDVAAEVGAIIPVAIETKGVPDEFLRLRMYRDFSCALDHQTEIFRALFDKLKVDISNVLSDGAPPDYFEGVSEIQIEAYLEAVRRAVERSPYRQLQRVGSKPLSEVFEPPSVAQISDPSEPSSDGRVMELAEAMSATHGSAVQHIVLLGEPGAGKSALLRHLARNAWSCPTAIGLSEPHLPVLIRLKAFDIAQGISWPERIVDALREDRQILLPGAAGQGVLRRLANPSGEKWLLLLDGLDEIPAPSVSVVARWTEYPSIH
jgi:hypothetical protein